MHPALSDQLLQFRKPGDNPMPIQAGKVSLYKNAGWVSNFEWILWARPVWYAADYMPGTWRMDFNGAPCEDGIRETDVLNVRQARETNDERHLAPLQLGVIDRVVKVWSAPGEIVYSPFGGIGSEGYIALINSRKFIGCELKESYWRSACRNLDAALSERNTKSLFDLDGEVLP
jgi:DNA modification methylase